MSISIKEAAKTYIYEALKRKIYGKVERGYSHHEFLFPGILVADIISDLTDNDSDFASVKVAKEDTNCWYDWFDSATDRNYFYNIDVVKVVIDYDICTEELEYVAKKKADKDDWD